MLYVHCGIVFCWIVYYDIQLSWLYQTPALVLCSSDCHWFMDFLNLILDCKRLCILYLCILDQLSIRFRGKFNHTVIWWHFILQFTSLKKWSNFSSIVVSMLWVHAIQGLIAVNMCILSLDEDQIKYYSYGSGSIMIRVSYDPCWVQRFSVWEVMRMLELCMCIFRAECVFL